MEDASLAALSADPERVLEAGENGATSYFERMQRDHPDELNEGLARLRADIAAGRAPQRPGTATLLRWTMELGEASQPGATSPLARCPARDRPGRRRRRRLGRVAGRRPRRAFSTLGRRRRVADRHTCPLAAAGDLGETLVEPLAQFAGVVVLMGPALAGHGHAGGGHAREAGDSDELPGHPHGP